MKINPKSNKLITAIKGSGGVISVIAQRLQVDWHTAKKAIDDYEPAKQAWQNEREWLLDIAEGSIINSINNGDTHDAKWVLTRLGKTRGYGDAMEIKGQVVAEHIFDYHAAITAITGRPKSNP